MVQAAALEATAVVIVGVAGVAILAVIVGASILIAKALIYAETWKGRV